MSPEPSRNDLVLTRLLAIDFDRRFYAFANEHRHSYDDCLRLKDLAIVKKTLELLGYAQLKCFKREKFFRFVRKEPFGETGFEVVVFDRIQIEFNLLIIVGKENLSQSYSMFALDVGRLREPTFEPSPPYPKSDFSNMDEFMEIMKIGTTLFEEARQAVLLALHA